MKIAVVSDDKESICHHFGKARGFLVFEIDDKKIVKTQYRENSGRNTGECGSCNHSRMIENIKDCKAVISFGMGRGIFNDLEKHGIDAIVTDEENAISAVNKYLQNDLQNRTDKLH